MGGGAGVLDGDGLGDADGVAFGRAELEASGDVGRDDGSSADEAPPPVSRGRSIATTVSSAIAEAAMSMTVRL